jgi:hypothetical protein
MIKKLMTCLLIMWIDCGYAQSIVNLDRDNGFTDIHLLSYIDSVAGFTSIFKDADLDNGKYEFAMFDSQYTYVGTKYPEFGEAKINKILLTTEKDYITEIKVVCEHDSSVLKTLYAMYGTPNSNLVTVPLEDKKAEMSVCMWQGKKVWLVFAAKKYLKKKDSDKSDIPDYMYLKYTALKADEFLKQK